MRSMKTKIIIAFIGVLLLVGGGIAVWNLTSQKPAETGNENVAANENQGQPENTNKNENLPSSGTSSSTSNIANENASSNATTPAPGDRPVQTLDITDLDEAKMITAVSSFADVFFNMNDISARQTILSPLIDADYILAQDKSVLKLDVTTNYTMSSIVQNNMTYISHGVPLVDSNYKDDGKCQVSITYNRTWTPDDPRNQANAQPITETVTSHYTVYMSNDYKIRDIRYLN